MGGGGVQPWCPDVWRRLRVGWGLVVVWEEEEGEAEPRFPSRFNPPAAPPPIVKAAGWGGCSLGSPPWLRGSHLSLRTFASPFSRPPAASCTTSLYRKAS